MMGCCFSWCQNQSDSEEPGENERRTLIHADANTSIQTNPPTLENVEPLTPSQIKKNDEQSDLNRILQNTITKVIDISALGCNNLEHSEYIERMNIYKAKLNVAPLPQILRHEECLLVDIPSPALFSCDITDYILINHVCEKAELAFKNVKVEHTNDLVVPFMIP
uniref:Ragulator complex protein LAMTOR1 n=1 Tax=Cacopsylla melanoneura TaxID=428564 RepID=A0A8D8SDU1_9HEMI